jgi:Spy/CpxP family protein refolding chaperone
VAAAVVVAAAAVAAAAVATSSTILNPAQEAGHHPAKTSKHRRTHLRLISP